MFEFMMQKVIIWKCSEESIIPSFEYMADDAKVRDTCWTTCNMLVTCSTKTKTCNYKSQSTLVIKGVYEVCYLKFSK